MGYGILARFGSRPERSTLSEGKWRWRETPRVPARFIFSLPRDSDITGLYAAFYGSAASPVIQVSPAMVESSPDAYDFSKLEFIVPGHTSDLVWGEHLSRYQFVASIVEGRRVLDVACGSGYGSSFLKRSGASLVVGVDISETAVSYAKKDSTEPSLAFVRADAESLPFANRQFDVVVTFETIEHLASPDRFLRECARVLRMGGTIVCSTPFRLASRPSWVVKPRNRHHVREYTFSELETLLGESFEAIDRYGQHDLGILGGVKGYLIYGIDRFVSVMASLFTSGQPTPAGFNDGTKSIRSLRSRKPGPQPSNVVKPLNKYWPGFQTYIVMKAVKKE